MLVRAGEMAQLLFQKTRDSVSSTHRAAHNIISSYRESDALYWPSKAPYTNIVQRSTSRQNTQAQTKFKLFFVKKDKQRLSLFSVRKDPNPDGLAEAGGL